MFVALCGVVAVCLPLDSRFEGSNPAEDDGIRRSHIVDLLHVKNPCEYERHTSYAKFSISFAMFLLLHH
jgi:hypothetical protein